MDGVVFWSLVYIVDVKQFDIYLFPFSIRLVFDAAHKTTATRIIVAQNAVDLAPFGLKPMEPRWRSCIYYRQIYIYIYTYPHGSHRQRKELC